MGLSENFTVRGPEFRPDDKQSLSKTDDAETCEGIL